MQMYLVSVAEDVTKELNPFIREDNQLFIAIKSITNIPLHGHFVCTATLIFGPLEEPLASGVQVVLPNY